MLYVITVSTHHCITSIFSFENWHQCSSLPRWEACLWAFGLLTFIRHCKTSLNTVHDFLSRTSRSVNGKNSRFVAYNILKRATLDWFLSVSKSPKIIPTLFSPNCYLGINAKAAGSWQRPGLELRLRYQRRCRRSGDKNLNLGHASLPQIQRAEELG